LHNKEAITDRNPTNHWLVSTRPALAGFNAPRDSARRWLAEMQVKINDLHAEVNGVESSLKETEAVDESVLSDHQRLVLARQRQNNMEQRISSIIMRKSPTMPIRPIQS
jgi:hypothetical protein